MRSKSLLALVALSACTPENLGGYAGETLHDVFPFDQIRTWTYQTDDASIAWRLVARQEAESEIVENRRVYTITVTTDCFHQDEDCTEGGVVDTWKMSSDPGSGVLIYEMGGDTFDPPVLLADSPQKIDEPKTSESGGVTYTSTYSARETCPADKYWPGGPPECVRIDLTDGDADSVVAGTYWAVGNFGLVAYEHEVDGVRWGLKDFDAVEF